MELLSTSYFFGEVPLVLRETGHFVHTKYRTASCTIPIHTWTPICILYRCRLMSRQAILAFCTDVGMPCEARTQLSA